MSQTTIWDTEFRIVKLSPTGQGGPTYAYIKPLRRAQVAAATQAGIAAVLAADIPIGPNEIIEVLSARQAATNGTETGAGMVLS